jgi:hypothetical protein
MALDMSAVARVIEARNAFILAHMLPATVLRHAIGAAQTSQTGKAMHIMATMPELEAIAGDHIFEVLTCPRR